jgi:hypothetical protein
MGKAFNPLQPSSVDSVSKGRIKHYVRMLAGVAVVLVASAGAFGQRGRIGGYPPTMGSLPRVNPSRPGLPLPSQAGFGWRGREGGRVSGAVPYVVPYPVFVGGGDVAPAPSGDDVSNDEPIGVAPEDGLNAAPPPIAPSAVIPPDQSGRALQGCQVPVEPPPPQDGNIVFIALKDGSVYTAIAYWVQARTLHYLTPENIHNQVSLALVDPKTSATLNADRPVPLVLPQVGN